jgi:hypothetical protein
VAEALLHDPHVQLTVGHQPRAAVGGVQAGRVEQSPLAGQLQVDVDDGALPGRAREPRRERAGGGEHALTGEDGLTRHVRAQHPARAAQPHRSVDVLGDGRAPDRREEHELLGVGAGAVVQRRAGREVADPAAHARQAGPPVDAVEGAPVAADGDALAVEDGR